MLRDVALDGVTIGHEQAFLALSEPGGLPRWRSRDGRLEAVDVALVLPGLHAETRLHLADHAIESDLCGFFRLLAQDWQGWHGERDWAAYEDALALTCTNDAGNVSAAVTVRRTSVAQRGTPFSWTVRGTIPIDAGQLDEIADRLAAFLG